MNKSFLLTTTAIIITCPIITYYSPICPVIGILDIIIAFYTASNEIDEYIWRTCMSIAIVFLLLTIVLILRIIISFILFIFPPSEVYE